MQIAGYQINERIHNGGWYELRRALRLSDRREVLFKALVDERPTPAMTESLRTEHDVLRQLDHPSIVKALGMEQVGRQQVLVREYCPAVPLNDYLGGRLLDIGDICRLILSLLDAVAAIHSKGILHGNLNLSNLLIDPGDKRLTVLGFSQARMRQSWQRGGVPVFLTSRDMHYLAPEQSGRMNRSIDLRADIYALGVIFFKLLTGRTPFQDSDSLALLHSHAAKAIPDPRRFRNDLPDMLSRIVIKMLAKDPDERYGSIAALLNDIEICQKAWLKHGRIPSFEIDRSAGDEPFCLTGRLYGREPELAMLDKALAEAGRESSVLFLVAGRSGIGKSSLIEQFRSRAESGLSLFLTAKFDQYKPVSALPMLHEAFRGQIVQLLGENEAARQGWRERLERALAGQGQALIEVMPELEWLLGPQPPLPELPSGEARNRLRRVLLRFMQVFATPHRPLCLFVDNLQWAPEDFFEWLEYILSETRNLLWIGAYRDNRVSGDHPLFRISDTLRENGVVTERIELKSLQLSALSDMLTDALTLEPKAAEELAVAMTGKTKGNPFFFLQYLRQLQHDGLIRYVAADGDWQYDLEAIRAASDSEDVVDFMFRRISALNRPTQELLKLGACFGNTFEDYGMRALLEAETDLDEVLAVATASGFLVRLQDGESGPVSYGFSHDRVQQASRALLDDEELQRLHLRIGRWLWEQAANRDGRERLMSAVDHLNAGRRSIDDEEELKRLGAENFSCGLWAKHAGAFEQALPYLRTALDILPHELERRGGLASALRHLADCEHLCGNHEEAGVLFGQAVSAARSDLEKARIFEQLIQYHADLAEFDRAYDVARSAMRLFGMDLPPRFRPIAFAADFLRLKFKLRRYSTQDLLELPVADNPRIEILIRLLSATLKIAYQLQPELCVALSLKLIMRCLDHGNTREAVIGYTVFGVIFLGGVLEKHRDGYDYGRLALGLLDRFANKRQLAEVKFVYGYFANSWTHSAADTENHWREAIAAGLETGDWFHTGCAACALSQSLFMRGVPLSQVWAETESMAALLRRLDCQEQAAAIMSVRQAIRNVQGKTAGKTLFSDEHFDESAFVADLADFGSRHFAHYYFVNKMFCLFLWGEYRQALQLGRESARFLKDSQGMLHALEHRFYLALAEARLFHDLTRKERRAAMRGMRQLERKLARWAERCPENFIVRLHLLRAEMQRLRRSSAKAMQFYLDAAEAAGQLGQLHLEALAHECAARLHAGMGQEKMARHHFNEAVYCYRRWGADGYLHDFSISLRPDESQGDVAASRLTYVAGDQASPVQGLDVTTLIKATETLASERRFDDLLRTLMNIVIENACAQRGILLLRHDRQLQVQAEASADPERFMLLRVPLEDYAELPKSIVTYVAASGEAVVLDNAVRSPLYGRDRDVGGRRVRSLLCAPLLRQGEVKGVLYLENNAADGVFTDDRVALLQHLSGQIAISLDNAQIYQQLEEKVAERTRHVESQKLALEEKNRELEARHTRISGLNRQLYAEIQERQRAEEEVLKANEELHRLATVDALTQVANRRYFDQRLEELCRLLQRDGAPLSLLLCDIDYFKNYNDRYGHRSGDDCLVRVARAIADALHRPGDFVARYGGEEFAVIVPHTDLAGAIQVAESIMRTVSDRAIEHQGSLIAETITLSIGIVEAKPGRRHRPEHLIDAADQALYRVKEHGRNGIRYSILP